MIRFAVIVMPGVVDFPFGIYDCRRELFIAMFAERKQAIFTARVFNTPEGE